VLILGLDNAGKTTYLEAAKTHFTKNYKALKANKITSTVGLNIGVIETKGCQLNFWDLGGQEELQSLWDKVHLLLGFLFNSLFPLNFIKSRHCSMAKGQSWFGIAITDDEPLFRTSTMRNRTPSSTSSTPSTGSASKSRKPFSTR